MNTSRGYVGSALLVCAMILVVGFFTATFFAKQIDRDQRTALIQQAQYAALLIDSSDVAQLTGSDVDVGTPTYERLKSRLMAFRSYNPRIRFVYLMGYRPDIQKQFFYVDSEVVTSPDYSPPGQIFEETLAEDIAAYRTGREYTSGPYRDAWGEWVSGYTPIKNEQGQTLAMVGIDIATSIWHRDAAFVWAAVGSITLLLCIVVFSLLSRIYKKQRTIDVLKNENRSLEHTNDTFTEIQNMAQLGKIIFYFKEKTVTADDQFKALFAGAQSSMSFLQFLSFVHPNDQTTVKDAFDEITGSGIRYSWFDARVGSTTEGYRMYHFYGNIDRGSDGAAIKFSGIMQDITDIQK